MQPVTTNHRQPVTSTGKQSQASSHRQAVTGKQSQATSHRQPVTSEASRGEAEPSRAEPTAIATYVFYGTFEGTGHRQARHRHRAQARAHSDRQPGHFRHSQFAKPQQASSHRQPFHRQPVTGTAIATSHRHQSQEATAIATLRILRYFWFATADSNLVFYNHF